MNGKRQPVRYKDLEDAPRVLTGTNFRPVGTQILVRIRREDQVPNTIQLADGSKGTEDSVAYVVAVGKEVKEIKPGDLVIFRPNEFINGVVHRKDICMIAQEGQVAGVLGGELVEWLRSMNAGVSREDANGE